MANDVVTEFESFEDYELQTVLRDNSAFANAVFRAIPDLSAESSFDLFGKEWVARYWKRLVMEVQTGLTSDGALKWAVSATVAELSTLISTYFGVSDAAFPACVALAILIIRAAKSEKVKA